MDTLTVRRAKRHLCSADPLLAAVIRRVGTFALKPEPGGYEILVRSILSQQISTAAARTIRGRLQEMLPGGRICPEAIQAMSDADLQQAGISSQKRSYLRDLTARTLDGSVNFRRLACRADEDAIAELIQVKGIGRWTAQMYLIFSLGRPDVFAPDDLGLRNAIRRLYKLPDDTPRSGFELLAAAWAPYRTVASWYLWRSLDQ
jgi:DNA-3-methyladenine glycosylase II